jgi:cytidine deaminase
MPSAKQTAKRKTRQTGNIPAMDGRASAIDDGLTPPGERAQAEARADAISAINVLIEVASNTRRNAYAPYSGYRVGAALLTATGNVYAGCNVENAAYGMTICAERAAVVKAISEGEREFDAIAVVTEDGGTPCGECRQFLHEFGADIAVIVADRHGHFTVTSVGELLPNAFTLNAGD